MRERFASKINQHLGAQEDLAKIDPRLLRGVTTGSEIGASDDVEKTRSSIEMDEELDDEQVLTDEIEMQANKIISAISSIASDPEVGLHVGEEDLQVDLEHLLLEALEDDPARDEHDHIHTSGEDFIRFFAQINVIRNRNAARLTDERYNSLQMRSVWLC